MLNTGSRLYNHPALAGSLPEPWLPVIAEPRHAQPHVAEAVKDAVTGTNAVIVDLRRRWSIAKRAVTKRRAKNGGRATGRRGDGDETEGATTGMPRSASERSMDEDHPTKAWRGSQQDRLGGFGGMGGGGAGQAAYVQEPIGHASLSRDDDGLGVDGTNGHGRGDEDGEQDEDDLFEEDEGAGLSRYVS